MPIYEYKCKGCGEVFEVLMLSSDGQAVCPSCKSTSVEKMMSACNSKVGSRGGSECPGSDYCRSAGCCVGGTCKH